VDGEAAALRHGIHGACTSTRPPTGATPQRRPIFGRGVPKTAIAPTTSSQNGNTPTPGIASRTSPGKSSHCQPTTTNSSAAVTASTAHPIGGATLAKAPMASDTPATTKASASRDTENLRGVEAGGSVACCITCPRLAPARSAARAPASPCRRRSRHPGRRSGSRALRSAAPCSCRCPASCSSPTHCRRDRRRRR